MSQQGVTVSNLVPELNALNTGPSELGPTKLVGLP